MLNISNHPYAEWPEAQRMAVEGEVVDAPFPHVEPEWEAEEINAVAYEFAEAVAEWAEQHEQEDALVEGQSAMASAIVSCLQSHGINCMNTKSPRQAQQNPDGSMTYVYDFQGFRDWPLIEMSFEGFRNFPTLDTFSKIEDVDKYAPTKMDDKELVDDHRIVHAWMSTIKSTKDFKYSEETVQQLHDGIVRELLDRDFRHYLRSDMDRNTMEVLSEAHVDKWVDSLREDIERFDPESEKAQDAAATLRSLSQKRAVSAISKIRKALRKAPISWKPSKPAHRLIDLEEDLSDVKEPDVLVQVKFDGIRIIAMRTDDTINILSEDQLYEKAKKLPTLVEQLKSLPGGDYILDAEALLRTEDGKDYEYRTEIAGVLNSKEKHEREADVQLLVFDILQYQGEDLKNKPLSERLERFDDFKNTDDIKFVGKDSKYSATVKDATEQKLKSAIDKVTEADASEGAMIKGLDSRYKDTDAWYKYKQEFELDGLVVEKRKAGTGAFTYALAIGPISAEYALGLLEDEEVPEVGKQGLQLGPKRGDSNPPLPPAARHKGKHWMVTGRAFNTGFDIPTGGVLRVAVQQVLETDLNGYKHYTIFLPRPVDDKSDDQVVPDDLDTARRLSKKSLRRVRAPEIGKFIRKKEERGERLPDDVMDSAKDGEPLPMEHYKYPDEIANIIGQGRKFKGWAQLHWRGMKEKGDTLQDHSVHCDVRLELPKSLDSELIQWVLAGKQDKLVRGILGLNNPASGKPQSLMAIVKPSAYEAGARVQQLVMKDTGMMVAGEGFDFTFAKASIESISSKISGRDNSEVESGEELIFPQKGYWISPDDPVNFSEKSWQYMQLIEEFEWLPGVQRTNAHEYFFYGKYFSGRYVLRALKGGADTRAGEAFWLYIKPTEDQKPMDPSYHKDEGKFRPLYPGQLKGRLG